MTVRSRDHSGERVVETSVETTEGIIVEITVRRRDHCRVEVTV